MKGANCTNPEQRERNKDIRKSFPISVFNKSEDSVEVGTILHYLYI